MSTNCDRKRFYQLDRFLMFFIDSKLKIADLNRLFNKLIKKFYKNCKYKTINQWVADKGDVTFRINYNLNQESIVFDLGGYHGQWASDIFSKYLCKIYIFEPVREYFDQIIKRFQKNNNIIVYNFGLANLTRQNLIYINGNSSSLYRKKLCKGQKIQLMKASDFFKENQIEIVDLMKINIEGAEYDLLDHLIESNLINKIKNLQIQFHNIIPNAEIRMKTIQEELSKTHSLTYQYPFVWENWEIKN